MNVQHEIVFFSFAVSYFIDGRSPTQCAQRWNSIDPSIKRGKWGQQEDVVCIQNEMQNVPVYTL